MMNVRPYIIYGRKTMDEIDGRIRDCLACWREGWGLPGDLSIDGLTSDVEFKPQSTEALISNVPGKKDAWVAFFPAETSLEHLGGVLLNDGGLGGRSPVERELAERCLTDLAVEVLKQEDAVLERLPPPSFEPICRELGPGSGTIYFRVSFGDGFAIDAYVSSAVFDAPCSSDQDLKPVSLHSFKDVIGTERIRATVMLSDVEITLDALGSISIGDVILMDQSVDEPCIVRFDDSELTCRGHLGRKKGNLAVRIDSVAK